jgi:hypothetical protein
VCWQVEIFDNEYRELPSRLFMTEGAAIETDRGWDVLCMFRYLAR